MPIRLLDAVRVPRMRSSRDHTPQLCLSALALDLIPKSRQDTLRLPRHAPPARSALDHDPPAARPEVDTLVIGPAA